MTVYDVLPNTVSPRADALWRQSVSPDIHNAIIDDSYMFIVIHGPPRCSKSTLAMWLAFSVYEDWDKAIESTVFNYLGYATDRRWSTLQMANS